MSCIKLKPIIILILALWPNIAVAACYDSNNEFDNGDIKGMYIEFTNKPPSRSCSNGYEAPYIFVTPEGSGIKSSPNIQFTITEFSNSSDLTQAGDKVNLMRIYSQNLELAEIFIYYDGSEKFISSSPPNIVHQNFELDREYIITNNHIQFASISEIQFADTPKNNKEYQFIGKIDNIKYDNSPIVISRGYIIDYDNSFDYDADNRKKSATKLKEGIKSENKLIYYDYTLDYNPTTNSGNIKNIECKSGYSPGPTNAGYYFKKDAGRQIMFYGCCFKDAYDAGNQGHLSLKINQSVGFDPNLSYSSDYINQLNSADVINLLSNRASDIECSSPGGTLISDVASYYFDIDSCTMKLYGGCEGDKTIYPSSIGAQKLDFCSTIKIGHRFQDYNVDKTEIQCESYCTHQDDSNKLSYSILNGVVEISGEKCIGQTKPINGWLSTASNLPLGIDGEQNLQYVAGTADIIDDISCKSGYDGSVQYSFNNGNIIFHNENCVAKNYTLRDSIDNSLEGLNLDHIVGYNESFVAGSAETLGDSACQEGYSPNNLKYYFDVENSNPTLRIEGICKENSCLAADINNNNPINTLNISVNEINNNANCGNAGCTVNAEFFLDCDQDNNYTPSAAAPKKICQNDGSWSTSGSCICATGFIANGPNNCILDDYNSVLADLNALDFDIIKQDNLDINNIKTALSLVSSGSNGTNISWSSSDSSMDNNGGIGENGVVMRPNVGSATNDVRLNATISKGAETMQKTFNLKVIPYNEYSKYVDNSRYQYNKSGGYNYNRQICGFFDAEIKNSYQDCAAWCRRDRNCMYSFWRGIAIGSYIDGVQGKTCQKFSHTYQECVDAHGRQYYNTNLLYYKY